MAMATVATMAMMTVTAKVMASLTVMWTVMGSKLEAVVWGRCLLAVVGSGNKEDNKEMTKTTNKATEIPQ